MEILRLVAILLLIILMIVLGNKYVNNKVYTYSTTKDEIDLKFIRIGNVVKVKVETTIKSKDSFAKVLQLSDIPDWAKPGFEESGNIASSIIGNNFIASDSSVSFSTYMYAFFSKIDSSTYRMGVIGGNRKASTQTIEAFIYYLCE